MKRFILSKSMLCLFLLGMVCNVALAQTVVGVLGNPTTTLTDGNYVLVAMSDKGTGPVIYDANAGEGKHYRYLAGTLLNVGDNVLSKYVWTIDETTENGVQHITVTNYDDNTKKFPADGAKNQNFTGSNVASLKTEVKTIGGTNYIALTLDNASIGYIHANKPEGQNPCLSYWNGYGDSGSCIKFTFYPVKFFVQPETGKYYKLKGDNSSKPWLTNTLKGNSIVVSANESEAAIFQKTENGLVDIATGKYIGKKGNNVSLVDEEKQITIGEYNNSNGKYSVKVQDNYMYNNNTDGIVHESGGWITDIERYWGFIEVEQVLKREIAYTIDKTTGTIYKDGTNPNQNWNNTWKSTNFPELKFACTANNMHWASNNLEIMTGSGCTYTLTAPAGCYITSYSFTFANNNHDTGNTLSITGGSSYTTSREEQTVSAEYTDDARVSTMSFSFTGTNSKGVLLTNFTVTLSTTLESEKYHATNNVETNASKLGSAIGYYSYIVGGTKSSNKEDVKAAIRATTSFEELTSISESLSLNVPEVGKKYRFGFDFGGETGILYLQSVNSQVKGLVMSADQEENSLFLVENIDGNLRLKSVSTNKYLKEDENTRGLQAEGGNITFSAGANLGQIKIKGTSFLHAVSENGNYYLDHCGNDEGHTNHNFMAFEVVDKYVFPENGKTYYIYSDTYNNGGYVNRFLYADGANLKINTVLMPEDNYKWTCTVNSDGSMIFQNGAGKYLGHKVLSDNAYNFTVANTNVHNPNAVTLYSKEAARYVVVHNNGSTFDQSTGTYNQETDAYCTDFVFIEVNSANILYVNGDSKVRTTATWNNETKVLPASWLAFKGHKIYNPTLSVTPAAAYNLEGLYHGEENVGDTYVIPSLDDNLSLTANFTPAFFSTTYGEKWVRLQNCSNNSYWATVENVDGGAGKTATLDYADEKQLWCLVGTAENFVLYNKAAGDMLALKVTAATYGNGSLATLESDTQASWKLIEQDFGFAFVPTHNTNASNLGINMYGGNGGDLKLFGTATNNTGSYWVVEAANSDPTILNVEVNKVWESSPRVAELTFTVNGKASATRILGSVEGQALYLPAGATYEVSSMTYRGYTYNGCEENNGVLTASYTANDERTLYYSRRDGHPYRIPAIATAPNGDIFAICDYRPCNQDIGYGEVDLVCRVSSDNGVTWTEEKIIADGKGDSYAEGDASKIWQVGFGDPAIVADRERNEVLVMSVCGNQTCWDGTYGEDNENPNRVARVRITHDGEKWVYGDPEEVTYSVYPKFKDEEGNVHAASLFIGAGKICQSRVVKKGDYYRLYCAVWTVTMTQRQHHNYVIYSDNFGETWNVLGELGYENSASKWGNEPKVEELPDGTVVLSSRKYNGRYFNLFTFADDTYTTGSWKGEVGSNEVEGGLSFGGNSTNGEIYKVKAVHKESGRICDLMFQSIPTGSGRDNVAIYYKEMEYNEDGTNKYTSTTFAQNWTKGIHVSTKGSCYSTMISQADGRIAFFFEEEPSDYCMVYIPYSIEELTGGAYSLYTVNSTISTYGIGTFYASEAMQIPEGVKAYVAKKEPTLDNNVGVLQMEELDGIIPANTGAVITGAEKTYSFIPSISYGTTVSTNMLYGYEANDTNPDSFSPVAVEGNSSFYILSVKNGVAGFYKKTKEFNVYNNKAYLNIPGQHQTIRLRFNNNDGTTGIIEVPTEALNMNGAIYDLSGRRVEKATKGVYIVNGKKVIF